MYCPTIGKIVFWRPESSDKYYDFRKSSRYGKSLDYEGADKISVNKIIDLASEHEKKLKKSIGNKRI
jgi:hypothetical protein